MKIKSFLVFLILVFVLATVTLAKTNLNNKKGVFSLPKNAKKVSDTVYYLGESQDKQSGKKVQGYAIIKYKKAPGKPGTDCGNGICEPGENVNKCPVDCSSQEEPPSSCYAFLAPGAKWKSNEPYMVEAMNSSGIDEQTIRSTVSAGINKWEDAANTQIIDSEIANLVDGVDGVTPDGKNELLFGDIQESNAIGVTIIWGIFTGSPKKRVLVEWDQLYDQVDYTWSAESEGVPGKMDFDNIATHELGHSVGLSDLYDATCSNETMYGYAIEAETSKRTLEAGDITGISELYK